MPEQEPSRPPIPDDLPEEFQPEDFRQEVSAPEAPQPEDLQPEEFRPEAFQQEGFRPEAFLPEPAAEATQAGQVTLPLRPPEAAAPLENPPEQDAAVPRRQRAAEAAAPGRYRLATFIGGALLIALGIIYLWPLFANGDILIPEAIFGVAAAGFSLGALAYWLGRGRSAPGALFVGLAGLLVVGVGVLIYAQPGMDFASGWPLGIAAAGLAALLTFALNRAHDRRLIALGLALLAAGGAGALVTLEQLPADVLAFARQYGAWLAVILALGLLPLAVRRGHDESPREE